MTVAAVILGLLVVVTTAITAVSLRQLDRQRRHTATAERAGKEALAWSELEVAARRHAEDRADAADTRAREAGARADDAEHLAAELIATRQHRNDALGPDVLWALEQSRSERTWRQSVATNPDEPSVLARSTNVLVDALRVEVDATREEVGTHVELLADIPAGVSAGGSLLTLRAAQELLATVVLRAESSMLRVHADGRDLVILLESIDEHGARVPPGSLVVPASEVIELIEGGVRIRNAIDVSAAGPPIIG